MEPENVIESGEIYQNHIQWKNGEVYFDIIKYKDEQAAIEKFMKNEEVKNLDEFYSEKGKNIFRIKFNRIEAVDNLIEALKKVKSMLNEENK